VTASKWLPCFFLNLYFGTLGNARQKTHKRHYCKYFLNMQKVENGTSKNIPPRPRSRASMYPADHGTAQVLEDMAPAEDEMTCRKTSSSVFLSTNIDYVLRNLGYAR
jgi:nicotinamidase-related amidase